VAPVKRPDQPAGRNPGAPARPAGQRLSRAEIVATAIAIADQDGLDAVSMRRVAADLGSGTMSLYRHIKSREQLLDLMIDTAYAGMNLPPRPGGDWRADLALLANAQRRLMLAHPWVASLVGSRPPVLPGFLRSFDFALSALLAAGLSVTDAAQAAATINAFVVGFVLLENAEQEAQRRTGLTKELWRARNAPTAQRILDGDDYPAVARFIRDAEDIDPDTSFGTALHRVLGGLGSSLPDAP
jgi:AcrR family transcriptional regulator